MLIKTCENVFCSLFISIKNNAIENRFAVSFVTFTFVSFISSERTEEEEEKTFGLKFQTSDRQV